MRVLVWYDKWVNLRILPFDNSLADFGVDTISDLMLITINVSAINMAVANIDGILHSLSDLAGWGL